MTVAFAALLAAAIGAPHLLCLERVSPALAAAVWLGALSLRALAAIFSAIFVVLYLPTTEVFTLVTHWCWHAVIPFLATHLPLSGHALGDAAIIAPAFVLSASVLSVVVGLWRAARRVQRLLAHTVVGPGPRQSLVLADGDVMVGAAGLRRPQVVISAGALVSFDDQELSASLEHEHGHIARRHRYVLIAAEICRALARFVPGTRVAARELVFHLERDADRYAVARCQDPRALASAICKAAGAAMLPTPATSLGGGVVSRRIRLLLTEDERPPQSQGAARLLALVMATLVVSGASALPAAAHAGFHQAGSVATLHHCPT